MVIFLENGDLRPSPSNFFAAVDPRVRIAKVVLRWALILGSTATLLVVALYLRSRWEWVTSGNIGSVPGTTTRLWISLGWGSVLGLVAGSIVAGTTAQLCRKHRPCRLR